ncbi:MAG TPA: tRNA 2-thiouridine(34) synthase MnmA, partial [Myxococcales bacterium]|nr:tRNA 2-thiouridine(34) synthase MnmA [Myxococcales bacterium]
MSKSRITQDVRHWTREQIGLPSGARVAVAMSGGVDSSVVAALLVEAGYDVIGLTARLYDTEATEVPRAGSCCAPEDARDAKGVAAQLGFRHYVLDERQSFREEVIGPFIESWRTGQTPNPCVACNRSLKFDRLLKRALSLGAEVLATGHYAQLDADDGGRPRLRRGMDRGKDQAYFLYPLPAVQARLLRFPLGGLSKTDVREHAERLGLDVAQKAESMDICFVGAKKPADWMAAQGQVPGGELISLDGTRLGRHDNLAKFTVGQ